MTTENKSTGLDDMEFLAKTFEELTNKELYEIIKARLEIFLVEQSIYLQDLDDIDYKSLHCFLWEDGKVCAYLRAFYKDKETVKIGRVLTIRHGEGTGRLLMGKSIDAIKNKMKCNKLYVEAQKYAVPFYEKHGFKTISGDFLDAGIVHVAMERRDLGESS